MADIKYIIPFTYKWEGGLSRATSDTASKSPSPYTINGKTGWHTNKGITYPVFKAGATKHGYKDTLENFRDMPEWIWLKIAKSDYWDKINLDAVKSQAVANIMFSWIWGSGYSWRPRMQRYFKAYGLNWSNINDFKAMTSLLNQLTEKYGEKKIFDELVQQKKEFLLSLNQPANEKGWLNRLTDLQKYSYTLITDTIKNNMGKTIVIALLIGTAGFMFYKYNS